MKPKILAFPGWGNNAEMMKMMMGNLDEQLSKFIDIVYLDPTYETDKLILPDKLQQMLPEDYKIYRWGDKYLQMKEDVRSIYNIIIKEQNIIGLMGFSQGTYIVTELAQMANSDIELKKRLQFVILFSSNGLKKEKQLIQQHKLIQIPSLHTVGTRDWLELETWIQTVEYENPKIVITSSTHKIPKFSRDQQQCIVDFVKQRIIKPKL